MNTTKPRFVRGFVVPNSGDLTPETGTPGNLTPETGTPGNLTPETLTPETLTPETGTPGSQNNSGGLASVKLNPTK